MKKRFYIKKQGIKHLKKIFFNTKKLKNILLISFLLILFLLIFFIPSRKKNKKILIFYQVKPKLFQIFVNANGIISPYFKVTLKTKYNCEVIKIYKEEGDKVKKGTLILKLNSEEAEDAFNNLKDNLINIIIEKEQAKNELKRTKILVDGGALPAQNLETAKNNFYQINLKYQKIKKEFLKSIYYSRKPTDDEILQNKIKYYLRDLYIKSPLKGTIVSLPVNEGDQLKNGDELATIINLNKLKLDLNISEDVINLIKKGETVIIKSPAYPDNTFYGVVKKISYQPISETLFKVIVDITNRNKITIKPGISASAHILTYHKEKCLIVPTLAIINKNNNNYIYKLVNNKVKKEKIKTGKHNDNFTEILNGIKANDIIIVGDYKLLKNIKDGDIIKKREYKFINFDNE